MSQVPPLTVPWAENIAKFVAEYVPQRVLLSVFGFMAIVNAFTMRYSLNVALTQLDNNHQLQQYHKQQPYKKAGRRAYSPLPVKNVTQMLRTWQRNRPYFTSFKRVRFVGNSDTKTVWTPQLQTIALSSFYVGYAISHLPGGQLAERYGGKWVLASAICLTAFLTLLTPFVLQMGGPLALIVLRFLMGLSEGPTYPALCELLTHWVPRKERGKLAVLALSGGQFAQIFVNLCSTLLLQRFTYMLIFYFFGAGALLWLASFILLCHDEPGVSPFIRAEEREYLRREISSTQLRPKSQLPPTPWREIFKCAPIWAMISATIQHDWTQANSVSIATQHLRNVKQQPLRRSLDASVQASMPTFFNWLASLIFGWISDFLIRKNWLTTTGVRKLITAIAIVGPNVYTGISRCFTCSQHKDVATQLSCALGVLGSFYAGIQLTPLDLSPNYAATLMAISNGVGALATLAAPFMNSLLEKTPLKELRGIFWLICTLLISGDVQAFNDPVQTVRYDGMVAEEERE